MFTIVYLLASCSENEQRKMIVCWGDSLTAPHIQKGKKQIAMNLVRPLYDFDDSYPNQMVDMLPDTFRIVNCGVGGETTLAIMCRQGGAPLLLAHNVTVFKDPKVVIGNRDIPSFISSWDSTATNILLQSYWRNGGSHVNPAIVDGKNVELNSDAVLYKNESDQWRIDYTYSLTMLDPRSASEEDTLHAGTVITTQAMRDYRGAWCNVFFMGQNGGYRDAADLIAQFKAMIDYSRSPRYIVVSHHVKNGVEPTVARMIEVEDSLQKAFGERYINLRKVLITEGLQRAGLSPTQEDQDSIAHHQVPPQLMKDGCHFTKKGYNVLAQLVAERIKKLYIK